jgi:hypothetical protein
MTGYFTNQGATMNYQKILTRAVVTAVEAVLAVLLASGLTDLSPNALETAAITGAAAGLSVIYNALRQWLDTDGVG